MSGQIILSEQDCRFETSSGVDPVGRLFSYKNALYRGIAASFTEFVLSTLAIAEERRWFDLGLVYTWPTSYSLPQFPLVIGHRRVPFVTVRGEWPAEALRQATLCFLKLASELDECGLCFKDAHTWNILFEGTRPIFVDWGSIRPKKELNWEFWFFQFRKYFLMPLFLFSLGQDRLARALVREHSVGVGNELIDHRWTSPIPFKAFRIYRRHRRESSRWAYDKLAKYVAALRFPHPDQSDWAHHEQLTLPNESASDNLRRKELLIHRLLEDDPATTVLDLGCNYGRYSEMATRLKKTVLAVDTKEICLDALYLRARQQAQDILPLYIDILWPIGESGYMLGLPSALERLRCDTVLALDLVHHLSFKFGLNFETLGRTMSRLARIKAIVEFVPVEDIRMAQWSPEHLPWYRLDYFLDAMSKYFDSVTVINSEPSPRVLVVLEGPRSSRLLR